MGRKSKAQLAAEAKAAADASKAEAEKQAYGKTMAEAAAQQAKWDAERKVREDAEKKKANEGIKRAVGHLRDYAQHLETEGFPAMAKEIIETADGLSNATLMLGFPVAYTYTLKVNEAAGDWKKV